MDGGEEVENKKRTGLVVVLGVLIAAIVGLVITVVVLFLSKINQSGDIELWQQEFGDVGSEQLSGTIDGYLLSDGGKLEDLEKYLDDIMNHNISNQEKIDACYYLAMLKEKYHSYDDAISVVNECLAMNDGDDKSDDTSYHLLTYLSWLYEESGQTVQRAEVLERILELPDDMVLEDQDWEMIKHDIKYELVKLREVDNEQN